MIYFVQLHTGAIKIGFTENLEQRLSTLTSYYGADLTLLATMPGGRDVEGQLHERFSSLRLGRTEQFRPGRALLEFIDRPLLVSANPETIEAAPCTMRRKLVIGIRASEEWKEWLDRYAVFRRMTLVDLIDRVLEEDAKRNGFEAPPMR